jgi:hypothetical protein
LKEDLCVKRLDGYLIANPCGLIGHLQTITAQEPPIIFLCDRRNISIELSGKGISQILGQEELRRMLSFCQCVDREIFLIGRYML